MRALRWPAVKEKVGLSRSTVWRLEQAGLFPRRRQLSFGTVAWLFEELDEWLEKGVGDAAHRSGNRSARDLGGSRGSRG